MTPPAPPAPARLEVAAALERAAEILQTYGWHQGANFKADGEKPPAECPQCAYGAISTAVHGAPSIGLSSSDPEQPQRCTLWLAAARAAEQYVGENVADWNDNLGRTVDEVTGMLRASAQMVRAGGVL